MKKLIKFSFIALVAVFSFASCETKNTENATENTGEAVEADAEATGEAIEADADQAVDATTDAVDEAGEEVKEETN
jgi:hypothetical protein